MWIEEMHKKIKTEPQIWWKDTFGITFTITSKADIGILKSASQG